MEYGSVAPGQSLSEVILIELQTPSLAPRNFITFNILYQEDWNLHLINCDTLLFNLLLKNYLMAFAL